MACGPSRRASIRRMPRLRSRSNSRRTSRGTAGPLGVKLQVGLHGPPDPLVVQRPDAQVIRRIGIQEAGSRGRVACPARVGRPGDELGEAHGARPPHVGAAGEFEVIVGDRVAVGVAGGLHRNTTSVPSTAPPEGGKTARRRVERRAADRSTHLWVMRTRRSRGRLVGVGERVRRLRSSPAASAAPSARRSGSARRRSRGAFPSSHRRRYA